MVRRTLREWRAYRKYTKSAMAAKLGIHNSTYKRIEDYPEKTTFEEAVKLAEALECQISEIIFFEGNPNFMLGEVLLV
ncbi:helix-turn-helix transcriptional regulator [Paenibacillus barcinonensis]|uniref:DNA-binding XRE family transcriptional regulator n=1 Tax=Paenibacillus barcinonensis TaxID=198119 RepID=A0A2V4VQY4_PAEBA|nr:helix-turn-helix transcriptional regulator [Paenibacillus barcinonensis]PYE52529.1 DNA-binding XRE family transcriptional regulator [Paenibacillus barcinonensis]QKS59314.1 helix-turn-helix transcriptional regulator [Paenibacillus barcinonensis]QKS59368.1 helix-turn-helix transcriptional regulator [Paenibacillus barcinonensis]